MTETMFEFLGQAVTLPLPHERTLDLKALEVSDVITPGREFVESIKRFGVITPIVVFDDGSNTRLRVADGRRRIAAAKLAGLSSVPATVYEANSFIPDLITMVLNEQRRDNPVADFNAIQRLQRRGATECEISEITGMPIGRIRRRMKLATLHPDIVAGLGQGHLAVAVAESIAPLPRVFQDSLRERLGEKGKLTMSDVRDIKVARKQQAAETLVIAGLGELLNPTVAVANLPDIVAALRTTTLHCMLDELPTETRFEPVRQIIAHELGADWRVPLPESIFTRAGESVHIN